MLSKIISVSVLTNVIVKAATYYSVIGVFDQRFEIEETNTTGLPPDLAPQGVNNTVKQMLLDKHNYYRSLTALGNTPGYPSATNIESLIWDPALESVAQTYAEQCIWNHNANRKAQFYAASGQSMWYDSTDIGVGENLYGFAPGSYDPSSIVWGIGSWYNEYPNWNYGSNGWYPGTCTSGQVCGHFTQLTWGNTRYVGCGVAYCGNGLSGWINTPATIVVCDYWPPGNYGGRYMYNPASDASKVASECNERSGDKSGTGLCNGCYSKYGTQCEWNQYSTCSPDDCASDTCLHCHSYCLNDANSTCSSTCLDNMNKRDQCTDNLDRNIGTTTSTTTTTTTTTKPPTPRPTTPKPTTTPTPKPTTPTTTTSTTVSADNSLTGKCCAKNTAIAMDVTSCAPLNAYRCALTRKCQLC